MTVQELIAKIRNSCSNSAPPDSEIHRRDTYVKAVATLVADVQKWLTPACKAGVMDVSELSEAVHEEVTPSHR